MAVNGNDLRLAADCESAPYNAGLGIRVESVDAEGARIRVPYKDENSNPGQALHGGVAASTIGIAGALVARACFADLSEPEVLTLDLSVNYLAAAIGEDIIASAAVLRRGKELVYSDIEVSSEGGKRIAKGLATSRVVPRTAADTGGRQRFTSGGDVPAAGIEVPKHADLFVSLPFISRLGMKVVHARDGEAFMRMPFGEHITDRSGAIHEGSLAALIDTTGAMASWSITGLNFRYKASTVGIHVSHHAAAGEDVVAHARTVRRNEEIFLNQVTVSGAQSRQVFASGSVTYRIVVP